MPHKLSTAARLLGEGFQLTGPAPQALGPQEYLGFQAIHNEAFADWQFNPTSITLQGDTARLTIQITATHTGAFDVAKLGVPIPAVAPTGLSRAWPVEHTTVTVKDGKVTRLDIQNEPGGGVPGTLAWLGVRVAAPAI
jgi:hypothetical protein